LINQLAELIPNLQQDPTPVTHLIEYLIRSPNFTFNRVLAIKPPVDFAAGLSATLAPINLITLRLLNKASLKQSDSDFIAGQPNVVAALIRLWLSSGDIAVAQMSLQTIIGLLTGGEQVDTNRKMNHENLMWRRIFRDRDVYGSIFALCSLKTVSHGGQLSKHDKTRAQARLLELLQNIESESVRHSQIPDIERIYGLTDGGLLHFAMIHMIDFTNDVLMARTLIHFSTDFLRCPPPKSDSSNALDILIETGLHSRIMSYYVDPSKHDHLDLTFLYGASATYISVYVSVCASHFLSQPSVLGCILARLTTVFEDSTAISRTRYEALKHDCLVLECLPEAALRQRPQLDDVRASFVSLFSGDGSQTPVSRSGMGSEALTIGR
jgi:hypothetical protein